MVKPATQSPAQQHVPFLIGGHWTTSRSGRFGPVYNPSTGEVIATVPFCTAEEVDRVVQTAAAAFPAWAETPIVERARVMFQFRERLAAHADELASLATREHGKTLGESRASVQRGIEMVEFACGIPSLLMGQTLANIARAGRLRDRFATPWAFSALGITPFNFPVMVPLWMFPVAILACGNTFVLKPSEKVPLSGRPAPGRTSLIESGLPEGVFNIVHGDKECAHDALISRTRWSAVSFVGSDETWPDPSTRPARETARGSEGGAGGAKNHMIVMPDADLGPGRRRPCKLSAFGCAGERWVHGRKPRLAESGMIADSLVDRLCESWHSSDESRAERRG